jgi:hypothetical protein
MALIDSLPEWWNYGYRWPARGEQLFLRRVVRGITVAEVPRTGYRNYQVYRFHVKTKSRTDHRERRYFLRYRGVFGATFTMVPKFFCTLFIWPHERTSRKPFSYVCQLSMRLSAGWRKLIWRVCSYEMSQRHGILTEYGSWFLFWKEQNVTIAPV